MTLRFDGQVAIVTGAGRGIGREHAVLLARLGASVVVNDVGRGPDGSGEAEAVAEAVAAEVREAGGAAVADSHSVADPEGAAAIVGTALDAFGGLDILVNNAGVVQADWDTAIAVNLTGTFRLCQAAWPVFSEQRYGRILNTTSSAGLFGLRRPVEGALDFHAYGAAKAGVCGLTRNLALEGEELGIKANAVAPYAHSRLTAQHPDRRVVDWLAHHFPSGKVAPACMLLVHESCPVNGEMFSVGGGRIAHVFAGETQGWFDPEADVDDFVAHFAEALERDRFMVPESTEAESRLYAECVRTRRH